MPKVRFKPSIEDIQGGLYDLVFKRSSQARAIYEQRGVEEHRQPYRVAFSDYFKGKDLLAR